MASTAGWLHVFAAAAGAGAAAAADCGCWVHAHAGAVSGQPQLSFSPDGRYLAVASGACVLEFTREETNKAKTVRAMRTTSKTKRRGRIT